MLVRSDGLPLALTESAAERTLGRRARAARTLLEDVEDARALRLVGGRRGRAHVLQQRHGRLMLYHIISCYSI